MPIEAATLRAALKRNAARVTRVAELFGDGAIVPLSDVADDELLFVVAAPNHLGEVGAIQAKCECGAVVWLSLSTQSMLKARGAAPSQIICVLCFTETLKRNREEKRTN